MDSIRCQLAALMHCVENSKHQDFRHPSVCKFFLTGICPLQLLDGVLCYAPAAAARSMQLGRRRFFFCAAKGLLELLLACGCLVVLQSLELAKARLGLKSCKLSHDPELREVYRQQRKTHRFGYEEASLQVLKALIDEADRKIERGAGKAPAATAAALSHKRCFSALKSNKWVCLPACGVPLWQRRATDSDEAVGRLLQRIEHEIAQVLKDAEDARRLRDSTLTEKLTERASKLQQRRRCLLASSSGSGNCTSSTKGPPPKAFRPCEVCGALLYADLPESDPRVQEHYQGRIHVIFGELRRNFQETLQYLQEAPPFPSYALAQGAPSADRQAALTRAISL
ncbi:u1 snrnp-associated protein usp106 [Cyclospora cayetanensis]|uniref:U1 snrnp-associated protein usp106 n=1 Tax=Cyclospora cayetanensis TaxID=88456 RepID=A0A1D3D4E1_9EIME|nr:u1 snrnp-associated protein usp106 [Cyclospora cayetanensis]